MLRRKAYPTETELHVQISNMINEALEMVGVETLPNNSSKRSLLPAYDAVPFLRDAPALP
jgi:hypothetical protein